MIDILVIRDAGDRDGGEITSPLICSVEAAVSRGQQEVDKHARARKVALKTVYRTGVRKGQIVEVHDSVNGPTWRGVIQGVQHVKENAATYTVLDVERPL